MSDKPADPHLPSFIPIIAGGVSGVLTRFLCQPLDVIKIRFQLQVEPISRRSVVSKYQSIPQALNVIVREEGLKAFWKGHVPAQVLSLTYGVFQFGVFEAMVQQARTIPRLADEKAKVEFVSGFTSGCVATILSFPLDIVRTRLVVQGNKKIYHSTINGLKTIVKEEGFRGLWRGLTPTLLQIGPLSGLQFAIFNFLKRALQDVEWLGKNGSLTVTGTMVAGSVSGFTAKVITYPMDLSRKRLQLQGFQRARIGFGKNFSCTSLTTCLSETVRAETYSGLFKGLLPSLLKASIVNALIFTFYEKTRSILSDIYKVPNE
uniref:Mitochondrial thiamine pyrophosphate carrier n=2 Tax=Graphocephala atropunctata TaxID=36148 RepID=A0A1B6M4R4_9HEMI